MKNQSIFTIVILFIVVVFSTTSTIPHNDFALRHMNFASSSASVKRLNRRLSRRGYLAHQAALSKNGDTNWPPEHASTGSDGELEVGGIDIATHSSDTPLSQHCDDENHPRHDKSECRQGCCSGHYGGGCHDKAIKKCVHEFDPFCTNTAWDWACVKILIDKKCGVCHPEELTRAMLAWKGGSEMILTTNNEKKHGNNVTTKRNNGK